MSYLFLPTYTSLNSFLSTYTSLTFFFFVHAYMYIDSPFLYTCTYSCSYCCYAWIYLTLSTMLGWGMHAFSCFMCHYCAMQSNLYFTHCNKQSWLVDSCTNTLIGDFETTTGTTLVAALCLLNQIVCYSTTGPRNASKDQYGWGIYKEVRPPSSPWAVPGIDSRWIITVVYWHPTSWAYRRMPPADCITWNSRRKLAGIMHFSTPRAAHTAGIIAKYFPNVSVEPSELLCGKDPSNPTSVNHWIL